MRLLLSLFLFFFTILPTAFTQNDDYQHKTIPERLEVHFNQDFYVTGEDIWYKIYVLHDDIRDIRSKIVRVEWLNSQGEIVENQALEISGNYAIGDFKIPYDWQAGFYTFRAYTTWSLNFGTAAVFTKKIPFYQVSTQDTAQVISIIDTLPVTTTAGELNIRFFTNKDKYQRRESVTLIVDVKDASNQPVRASLSLAVTDANFLPAPVIEEVAKISTITPPATLSYSAEQKFTVSGQLTDSENNNPITTNALSLYLPELQRFYRANSQNGKFSWDLPNFYTPTTLQVLNLNSNSSGKTPRLILQKKLSTNIQLTDNQPLITSKTKQYLHKLYQNRLINEVFKIEQREPIFVKQIATIEAIPADKTYTTEGFIKLRDVGEFIDEVILIARVNGSAQNKNRSVQLFNSENKIRFPNPPIYLVNGLLTTNETAVLNIPLQEVASMQTYVATSTIDQYFDPLFINSGVLSIITKNGLTPDFVTQATNQIQISGLYNAREFTTTKNVNLRSPILQPTIFWDGKIITNEYGKANVTFPLTDTSGKIWIAIEGISIAGDRGKLLQVLEVRD